MKQIVLPLPLELFSSAKVHNSRSIQARHAEYFLTVGPTELARITCSREGLCMSLCF